MAKITEENLIELNLHDVIAKNYDEIQAGKYDWSDEEVIMVYKMTHYFLKTMRFTSPQAKEDFVQESVTNFFTKYLPSFNPDKSRITTFYNVCLHNEYLKSLETKEFKTRINTNSFDNMEIEYQPQEYEIYGFQNSTIKSPAETYVLENWNEYLNQKFDKYPILADYFRDNLTYDEIASKHGISRTSVGKKINRIKADILKEIDAKDMDIPSKYYSIFNDEKQIKIVQTQNKWKAFVYDYAKGNWIIDEFYIKRLKTHQMAAKHNIDKTVMNDMVDVETKKMLNCADSKGVICPNRMKHGDVSKEFVRTSVYTIPVCRKCKGRETRNSEESKAR